ncbi:uncharacterized protein LOC111619464 [Centruroides sculpturatus]|uniref:uncharacterized protein LOC111619464 n=1 Tax=Centruroides sculpturatus TaxID=218467 RepID=UPI000C6E9216|nr:uncharacterized protein LOC111619464 [Centruroides sculpturatus]
MKICIAILFVALYLMPSEGQITERLRKIYCAIENQAAFRFCAIENNIDVGLKLFRNCMHRIKKFYTLEEISDYACNSITDEEFEIFKSCTDYAIEAEMKYNANFMPIIERCLASEKR